jgi:NADH-quinone oxidoreductase subunit L
MKDMGGLRQRYRSRMLRFSWPAWPIAGIPPFAGFFSKEEILTAAWHS